MYCLVAGRDAEQGLVNLGVLLEDPEADLLRLRFRRDLERLVADEEDREVLEALADDLYKKHKRWAPGNCSIIWNRICRALFA